MQNTVELESFDPREAHAFVLRVLPDSVPSYVTPLVAPLRYLPLSVSLAVSMLGEFEMKVIVDDFVLRVEGIILVLGLARLSGSEPRGD